MQSNPFIISGYVSAEYFCDRVEESARLRMEVTDGNNVALIAARRMGKSGLIKHVFASDDVKEQYYTQQIANYPEKNVEALLRTYVQKCTNAQFVFSGSQRHTMGLMFTSASRPFFQSVSMMHLDAISVDEYYEFAMSHFERSGKHLQREVVDKVFALCNGTTWYVQKMFNVLYSRTSVGEMCTADMVEPTLEYILSTLEYTYSETLFRMPEKQKQVFIAIGKEGYVKAITSGAFIHKYRLPSSSTVQSAVKGLLERDYITYEQGIYSVYDIFLMYWIQRRY